MRASLSVAVVGQVDSGKSTIVGHLRYQCGCVAQREMDKLTQQAEAMGRASFKFAWLCDKLVHERERGITIECTESQLFTSKFDLHIVDTPGHPSFVKHSIQGVASADHVVLVVDASPGLFEVDMAEGAATKEHALIAFAMGAKQIIVAVNKMDALPTPYAQERFDHITTEVGAYLTKLGFKDTDIQYVPVAGYAGENLVTKSRCMPWYDGVTLLEALDNLTLPARSVDKPFRMPVQDAYHVAGVGLVVTGCIQTGVLRPGMQLSFGPHGARGMVFSIESHHRSVSEAYPGMAVGVNIKGLNRGDVQRGFMASDSSCDAALSATRFTAQLVFVKDPATFFSSSVYTPVVHCHTAHVACRVLEITAKLDRATGNTLEPPASVEQRLAIQAGEACLAVLEPTKPVVLEAFREYPSLGRIVVRDTRGTVAVGIIKSVATNRS